jgi:myo-inositol 2-dehydrogenase/D-chiro-inositol 1-dehydrogenase
MRIGLIGLGRIGAFHADTLSALSSVTSLVVTDAVPAAMDSVVERLGVEAVETPEQLLAAGVDGVVVAAATDAHPELIVAAVEAGVPVFCEKPVARTMAEGVAVARRVAGTGVPIQIGYPRRFDPGFAAAREALASGELGWLHTVRLTTLGPRTAAACVPRRVGRHLPRLQRARLRRDPLGHWPRGRRGLCNGVGPG